MAKKEISPKAAKKAAKKSAAKSAEKPAKKAATKAAKKVAKKAANKVAKKVTAKVAKKSVAPKKKAVMTSATRKPARKTSPASSVALTPTLVAQTAYQIYLDRVQRGLPGDERSDWLAAEDTLRAAN